jgi:hypothetical protein
MVTTAVFAPASGILTAHGDDLDEALGMNLSAARTRRGNGGALGDPMR